MAQRTAEMRGLNGDIPVGPTCSELAGGLRGKRPPRDNGHDRKIILVSSEWGQERPKICAWPN